MREYLTLAMVLFFTLVALLVSAVDMSTDPADYNASDGVSSDDIAINGSTPSDGDQLENYGWTDVGGADVMYYMGGSEGTLGSISIKVRRDASDTYMRFPLPIGDGYTGQCRFAFKIPSNATFADANGYRPVFMPSPGFDDEGLRIGSFCSTTDWCCQDGASLTAVGKIQTGKWENITVNITSGNMQWYLNDTPVCSISRTFTGVLGIYFGSVTNSNFHGWADELRCTDDGVHEWPAGAAADTSAPSIPSPTDNSNNNTNVTINITHTTNNSDVRYWLYFGDTSTLGEEHLYLTNVTRTGEEYKTFLTNISVEGVYYFKAQVQNVSDGTFSLNTSTYTWILDTSSPTINILQNTTFETDNSTIISNYGNNLSINISFFDTNLAGGQTLINITNSTDESVFQVLNTSITGTTVNVSRVVDISSWAIGNYTVKLIVTDSHTANKIKPYGIIKGLNYFRYTTTEGNTIKVESMTMPSSRKTTKSKDRYSFQFDYLLSKSTFKYKITSYNKIKYLPESEYPAHFVVISDDLRGNWLDFGGIPKEDITVTKIDDYEYEVEIESKGKKKFTFNSLGGLNRKEENYLLRIGSTLDVWVTDSETGNDMNATVTYNGQVAHTIAGVSGARIVNVTKETETIALNATGYGNKDETVTITNSYHNLTGTLTPVNTVKAYFYDESSYTLIDNESFSVYLETTGFSNTYTAATNPYSIGSLGSGLYELKASSTNYPERVYFNVNVSNETTTNLNIYLINTTDSSEITFNVVDSSNEDIEDVDVDFYRTLNGTNTLIAQENTDYGGNCKLYLDTNYEYLINFSRSSYESKTVNLEPTATDSPYTITMYSSQVEETALESSIKVHSIKVNWTWEESVRQIFMNWSDPNNYASKICLKVSEFNKTHMENCSTLLTGTLNYTMSNDNVTYLAESIAYRDGNRYVLDSYDINLRNVIDKIGKGMGMIVSLLLFLTFALIGSFNPVASVVMGTGSLWISFLMGILPVGFGALMGLTFVALIVVIGMMRYKG
jgi:hypothetical protein